MKKILVALLIFATIIGLSSCATGSVYDGETFTFNSDFGDVEVPVNAERIVILDTTAAGPILKFGNTGSVVGYEYWTGTNPLYDEYLVNSTEVDGTSIEQVIALNPDLIITYNGDSNINEWQKIAPTVEFAYGTHNYLDAIVKYAEVIGKGDEARQWKDEFKLKTSQLGSAVKEEYGQDTSITVYEAWGDTIYIYGDNWGRGTQIVYQEMGLVMPSKVREATGTDGYFAISSEVIPEYAGDFIILSRFDGAETSFMQTDTWKNIPAVQNDRVLEADASSFYMVGPITLDYQYELIKEFFGVL